MKGFEHDKDILKFTEYLKETEQHDLFKNSIRLIQKYFPNSDFYVGKISKTNWRLSVGIRKKGGLKGGRTILRFTPNLKKPSGELRIGINVDKIAKKRLLRKIIEGKQFFKQYRDNNGERYYILKNGDIESLVSALETLNNINEFHKRSKGSSLKPDDYLDQLDETDVSDDSDEASATDESDAIDSAVRIPEKLSTRVIEGKIIVVSKQELKLTQRFVNWLDKHDYYNLKKLEQKANANDRIDVVLRGGEDTIYAELKSISSYANTAKRAIRAALGQILDYQYYDGKPTADELWIVLDTCSISNEDAKFIKTLNKKLVGLNLKIVVESTNGEFKELEL